MKPLSKSLALMLLAFYLSQVTVVLGSSNGTALVGKFGTQTLQNYNTNLMNKGNPYIVDTTNTVTAMSFGTTKLIFTIFGEAGTTGTVKVNCASMGEPYRIVGVTSKSYSDATKTCTLTITFSSSQEIIMDWETPAGGGPMPTPTPTPIPTSDLWQKIKGNLNFLLATSILLLALWWLTKSKKRRRRR